MGEAADMMLDGTLCEGCGAYIGEGDGYPRYCSDRCAEARGVEPLHPGKPKKRHSHKWKRRHA